MDNTTAPQLDGTSALSWSTLTPLPPLRSQRIELATPPASPSQLPVDPLLTTPELRPLPDGDFGPFFPDEYYINDPQLSLDGGDAAGEWAPQVDDDTPAQQQEPETTDEASTTAGSRHSTRGRGRPRGSRATTRGPRRARGSRATTQGSAGPSAPPTGPRGPSLQASAYRSAGPPSPSAAELAVPSSSPVPASSQIPEVKKLPGHKGIAFSQDWLDLIKDTLPTGFMQLPLAHLPLITCPFSNDVALVATNLHLPAGQGLAGAFGEGSKKDAIIRRKVLALCQFNAKLLIVKLRFSLDQARGEGIEAEVMEKWSRRLRCSIGLSSAEEVFNLPEDLVDDIFDKDEEVQLDRIVEYLFEASARLAPDLEFLDRINRGHPSLVAHVGRKMTPSLPKLGIECRGGKIFSTDDGRQLSPDEARNYLRLHKLEAVGQCLRRQGTLRLIEMVLLGTWSPSTIALVLSAATSGFRERPVSLTESRLGSRRMVKLLGKWATREDRSTVTVMTSKLLTEDERGLRRTREGRVHPTRMPPLYFLMGTKRVFDVLARVCRQRSHALIKAGADVPMPGMDEMWERIQRKYEAQGGRCAIDGGPLTLVKRMKSITATRLEKEAEAAAKDGDKELPVPSAEDGGDDDTSIDGEHRSELALPAASTSESARPTRPASSSRTSSPSPPQSASPPPRPRSPAPQPASPPDEGPAVGDGLNRLFQRSRWRTQTRNTSVDQKEPGKGYGEENVQLLAVATNFIKFIWTHEQAQLIVYELWKSWDEGLATTTGPVGSRLLTAAVLEKPPPPNRRERRAMEKLARQHWKIVRRRAHYVDLSPEDIYALFLERRCAPGFFTNVDGARLPMPLASVDRINSSIGYTKSNCRLILQGLNTARGEADDDEGIMIWYPRVNGDYVTRNALDLRARDFQLPRANWLDDFVDVEGDDNVDDDDDVEDPAIALDPQDFANPGDEDPEQQEGEEGEEGEEGGEVDGDDGDSEMAATTGASGGSKGVAEGAARNDDDGDQDMVDAGGHAELGRGGTRGSRSVGRNDDVGDRGAGEDTDQEFGDAAGKERAEIWDQGPSNIDIRRLIDRPIPVNLLPPRASFPIARRYVSLGDLVRVTAGIVDYDPLGKKDKGIEPDGNCLLRAVGQVAGWGHRRLRAALVQELHDNEAYWRAKFGDVVDGVPFEVWRDKQGVDKEWGDAWTLRVLRQVVGIPMVVVSDGTTGRFVEWILEADKDDLEALFIGLWLVRRSNHYEVMW